MSTECVLCDWTFRTQGSFEEPIYVHRSSGSWPLRWQPEDTVPVEINLSDIIAETAPTMALIAHWARGHPEQLRGLLGEDFVLDYVLGLTPVP